MSNFESGVASYIEAVATVHVFFPVDTKGRADVCCRQCDFFRRSSQRCGINGSVCQYPEHYVGASCPLHPAEEKEGG